MVFFLISSGQDLQRALLETPPLHLQHPISHSSPAFFTGLSVTFRRAVQSSGLACSLCTTPKALHDLSLLPSLCLSSASGNEGEKDAPARP